MLLVITIYECKYATMLSFNIEQHCSMVTYTCIIVYILHNKYLQLKKSNSKYVMY